MSNGLKNGREVTIISRWLDGKFLLTEDGGHEMEFTDVEAAKDFMVANTDFKREELDNHFHFRDVTAYDGFTIDRDNSNTKDIPSGLIN